MSKMPKIIQILAMGDRLVGLTKSGDCYYTDREGMNTGEWKRIYKNDVTTYVMKNDMCVMEWKPIAYLRYLWRRITQ